MASKFIGFLFSSIFFLVIVSALIGLLYAGILSIIYPIYDFFFHTRWGLMAVISLILSLVFAYASKKTHQDVKVKDRLMSSVKASVIAYDKSISKKGISNNQTYFPKREKVHYNTFFDWESKEELEMKRQSIQKVEEESVIDLSSINLQGLLMEMATAINKPAPIFFKGWANKRFKLDVERVNILGEYIKSIRNTGNEFLEMKADAVFSQEKLEHFLNKRRIESKNEVDLLTTAAMDSIDKFEHDKKIREQELLLLKTNIDRQVATTALLKKAADNWDTLTTEHRDIVLGISSPENQSTNNTSIDKDYKELDLLMKEQELNAKKIENKKSDIERKQMNDRYEKNKE